MALLNYICYRLLFDTFRLVNVLEGIYLLCLLMLDYPDLVQGGKVSCQECYDSLPFRKRPYQLRGGVRNERD